MSITATIQKINPFNSVQRFVKSKYHVAKFYSKDSKEHDENEKERQTRFNITTGAVRDNKESAKEENFFFRQSMEQLKALKQKFFGEKSEDTSKKKDSDDH